MPGTDAEKSIAFGPGLEDGVTDTLPTYFTIQAKDRLGRPTKKGGDPFQVKIKGPKGEVPCKVTDNGDGTYRVEYAPSDAGKHDVHVTLRDAPIMNAPFHVNVKHGADAGFTIIDSYSFIVQAKTKGGENKIDGGDDLKAKVTGPTGNDIPATVTDNKNGTYTVSYKLTSAGKYKVNVTVDGKDIKSSPFTQEVK